jgi:hypothetical protein
MHLELEKRKRKERKESRIVTKLRGDIASRPLASLALVIAMKKTRQENPQMKKPKLVLLLPPPIHALSIAWLSDKILHLKESQWLLTLLVEGKTPF